MLQCIQNEKIEREKRWKTELDWCRDYMRTDSPPLPVVYFDQRLGAAHPERWSKFVFLTFLMAKSYKRTKRKKFVAKFSKQTSFSSYPQNTGQMCTLSKN